jgi:heme-degrading monooxygenase HmoA
MWQALGMVLEIATFEATAGQADQFAQAYRTARQYIEASPGFRSIRMTRGVESPDRFVLLVEWETLEAHTETFRGSERFTQWRAVLGPHFDSAQVQHVTDL